MQKRSLAVLALVCVLAVSVAERGRADSPSIVFSPAEWDFGTLTAGSRAFLTLQVTNRGDRAVTVSVLPDCDCLSTGPSRRVIPAGSQAEFRFSFLAEEDESGEVRETYLIQTDLKGMDHLFYTVHGVVKSATVKTAP
jgi:hypothetical protein